MSAYMSVIGMWWICHIGVHAKADINNVYKEVVNERMYYTSNQSDDKSTSSNRTVDGQRLPKV